MEEYQGNMTETLQLTIYGNPRSKKNSSRIVVNPKTKRPFILPSAAYKKYEGECIRQIGQNYTPIETPVNVCCTYYMETKRKIDISNLNSSLHDILVKANILSDDNRDVVAGTDGSRVLYDKENPRVEIEISEIGKYEQWKKRE